MQKGNIFWVGYSDLLTSLFFVMLVLFVVSIGWLQNKINIIEVVVQQNDSLIAALKEREATLKIENEKLNNLLKLEELFKPLEDDNDFVYLSDCKKYIFRDFMGVEIFHPKQSFVKKEHITTAIKAGRKIQNFLAELNNKHPELSYLLVIKGNMANTWDKKYIIDNNWGYNISYKRALAVYDIWNANGINF